MCGQVNTSTRQRHAEAFDADPRPTGGSEHRRARLPPKPVPPHWPHWPHWPHSPHCGTGRIRSAGRRLLQRVLVPLRGSNVTGRAAVAAARRCPLGALAEWRLWRAFQRVGRHGRAVVGGRFRAVVRLGRDPPGARCCGALLCAGRRGRACGCGGVLSCCCAARSRPLAWCKRRPALIRWC